MVLIDGQPTHACTREVGTVVGRAVTTVEGLGTPTKPLYCNKLFSTSRLANAVIA
jgi:aerobic-type carbon monoxide dehydrogenase small subunit (CoxS/CutS family)